MDNPLTELPAPVLAALAKLVGEAAKGNRENLEPGEYKVSELVTLALGATVKVGEDYDQRIVGKAKPWDLLIALQIEANKRIATLAKLAGQDPAEYEVTLSNAVKLAESVDPELVKEAQKGANKEVAKLKAATVSPCKGKVLISGNCGVAAGVPKPEAA